jgi:hypothetical protein
LAIKKNANKMNPTEIKVEKEKKSWKKPVIEDIEVKETLSGPSSFIARETAIYHT